MRLADLRDYVVRNFQHVADDKGLEFNVDARPDFQDRVHATSSVCSRF